MPIPIRGNQHPNTTNYQQDLGYDYGEFDFRPSSDLHKDLVVKIMDRALYSYNHMAARYDSWATIDETLTAYKWVDSEEEEVQANDPRKPASIVFPFSYATMETMLTYIYKALTPSPIFRYEGMGPEDIVGAILLEMVIDQHCRINKTALNIHTLIRDGLSYGIGAVVPEWVVRRGQKRVKQVGEVYGLEGDQVYSTTQATIVDDAVLFEGNGLRNVNPYRLLLDPDAPSVAVQEMNFVGWYEDVSLETLTIEEAYGKGLFNVKYLKEASLYTQVLGDSYSTSGRLTKTEVIPGSNQYGNMTSRITMYITLIPKDWGLGNSELPEKWLFSVVNGDLLIQANKIKFEHGLYPIAMASPDFDGYSTLPMARLEIMHGMQHLLDWMLNVHVTNTRKAVNDMFVIDPWLLDYDDVANPEPGKLIKLRRPAWGKGVQGSIQQLQVSDVTRGNISDIGLLTNAIDKISGVDDAGRGLLRQGGPERLTKAEFQGTRGSSANRLERVAGVIALQALQDIGTMFASHTQQMMSLDMFKRVTGEWAERLSKTIKGREIVANEAVNISPMDLVVDYDLIVKDGTIPGGNFNEGWLQILDMIVKNPQAFPEYDQNRVFEWVAYNMGARNIADFKKVAGTGASFMPDEQVMKEVDKGNLTPIAGGQR